MRLMRHHRHALRWIYDAGAVNAASLLSRTGHKQSAWEGLELRGMVTLDEGPSLPGGGVTTTLRITPLGIETCEQEEV